MNNAIASQRYLDQSIVEAKSAAGDYSVKFVTVEIDGVTYTVVVDGHHRYAAAAQDGAEIVWTHNDAIQIEADAMGHDAYLTAYMQDDWYYIANGQLVF